MTLEAIYYIGQTVAVIAIVVSLVFVGVQIRQNTQQSKANATEAAHRSFLDWYYNQTPEVAAVFVRANTDFDSLSAEDRYLTFVITMPMFLNLQEAHTKWCEGGLAKDRWRFWDQFATIIAAPPVVEKVWAARRFMFSDRFQDYFDSKLNQRDTIPASAVSLGTPTIARPIAGSAAPSTKGPTA